MAFQPTHEQLKVLESTHSAKEAENLLALWEAEAPEVPEQDPITPATPADVSAPQVVEGVKPPPQEAEAPVAQPEAEVKDVEYWKKQAETWKERKGNSDRALGPSLEEAARLRKEREQERENYDKRLGFIEEALKQLLNQKQTVNFEPEEDDQFPEVTRRIRQSELSLAERIKAETDKKFKELEERNKRLEESTEEERRRLYAQSHFSALQAIHRDAGDFFDENKLAPAVNEWAKTQPPEFGNALQRPLDHTPQYVAFIISQFKQATRYSDPPKPTLGDMVVKATSTSPVKSAEPELDIFPKEFSEKDVEILLHRINNAHKHDPEKASKYMDEVVQKWGRTIQKRSQT